MKHLIIFGIIILGIILLKLSYKLNCKNENENYSDIEV